MKKILFRADGNAEIGLGHFMRLVSILEMLKADFTCFFAMQNPEEFTSNILKSYGATVIGLEKSIDYIAEATYLKSLSEDFDMIVLDGYYFTEDYQKIIKEGDWKLTYIDDLHSFKIEADLIINHAVGVNVEHYEANDNVTFCLGTDYAMLRKEFLESGKIVQSYNQQHKAFVCLGGSDPNDFTNQIIKDLIQVKSLFQIHVVVGKAYRFFDKLNAIKDDRLRILCGLSPQEMVVEMRDSTIGIVSSSNIAYEYASTGGMMFVVQTADNQKDIYEFLLSKGLAKKVSSINESELSEELFINQVKMQRKYFDGNSDKRIIQQFKSILC